MRFSRGWQAAAFASCLGSLVAGWASGVKSVPATATTCTSRAGVPGVQLRRLLLSPVPDPSAAGPPPTAPPASAACRQSLWCVLPATGAAAHIAATLHAAAGTAPAAHANATAAGATTAPVSADARTPKPQNPKTPKNTTFNLKKKL